MAGGVSRSGGPLGSGVGALALALALAGAAPAAAQLGPGPRALGVGGAFIGLARGYEAVAWNPANLALPDRPAFSVGLAGAEAGAASVGPGLLSFGILDDTDPGAVEGAEFLGNVPAGGAALRGSVAAPWIAVSAGPVGLAVTTTALATADIGRGLVELYLDAADDGVLDGWNVGGYRIGDSGYRIATYTAVTGGAAVPLRIGEFPVTVGIGLRGVRAHGLERGRLFEPAVDGDRLTMTGVAVRSDGGVGIGVDLGATIRHESGFLFGVAVENVYQRMTWDEAVELRNGEVTSAELDEVGLFGIRGRLDVEPFDDTAVPLEAYVVADELFDGAYFPRTVRAGAAYRWRGARAGITYGSTLGGGDLHAGWPAWLAVGFEQELVVLALRAGWATSFTGSHAITAGTTLGGDDIRFHLAGARVFGSEATPGTGLAFTIGLSVTRQ